MPIRLINGKLKIEDLIYNGSIEVGKILIAKDYPFAIIKYTDNNFSFDLVYSTQNAELRIIKPKWIK